MTRRSALIALLLAAAGCGTGGADNGQAGACTAGKCDTPDDAPNFDVAQVCEDRRAELLESNQRVFAPEFIRWSCADVAGVNTNSEDSRGQEYCEYWAALRPPPLGSGEDAGAAVTLGRPLSSREGDVTPLTLELSDEQLFYLEDHIDEVMGSCYFTAWHNDFVAPLPSCVGPASCATSFEGLPLDAATFQMKLPFNGNDAAAALVADCLGASLRGEYETGDPKDEGNPLRSDFLRGCHLADGYGLAWRKSDSSICAAAMRLGECGCASDARATAEALVPPPQTGALRGFPLGGWAAADRLPTGCSYVDTGDASRTIVRCALTAGDVLQGQSDLKGYCRARFAENVVVYVPVPAEQLSCSPGNGPYAESCGETPWVVSQ